MLAVFSSRRGNARGRTRRAIFAAIGASVLIVVLATPALGAPRPLTMDVLIGDYCVSGLSKPNTVIKVSIKDVGGAPKGQEASISASDGYWSGCVDFFSDAIASGDRIKVVDYDTNQTLNYTVPRMTLSANRSTDVASGVAPAGLHMTLEAADFNTPLFGKDPYDVFVDLVADGGGTWSHDFGADNIDLMTGAGLELSASGAGGAVTVRRDFSVPGLFVLLDSARFGGYMRPYFPIGITLKTGGSTVATGHAVGDASGQYDGRFVDGVGEPYRLMGGETLSAPKLGISWTVPQVNGTANRQSDVVAGTCFANNPWVVIAGVFAFANGMTDGSGAFSVDLSDQGGIAKGDQVIIGCFSGAGDVVEEDLVVN